MIAVGAAGLAFSGVAAYAFSLRTAASVGVGGAIALVNLWVLTRVISSVMPDENGPRNDAKAAWGILGGFKFVVLLGGVWFLMTKHVVDPIPLLVGFGALPIGIAIGALVRDTEPQSSKPHA